LISSLVKSVRSEARRLLMSGFSACAGPLLIPVSRSAVNAKAVAIGLRVRLTLPADSFTEGGRALANDNGTHIFVTLRKIIGLSPRAGLCCSVAAIN
jgi:hypothetical protein